MVRFFLNFVWFVFFIFLSRRKSWVWFKTSVKVLFMSFKWIINANFSIKQIIYAMKRFSNCDVIIVRLDLQLAASWKTFRRINCLLLKASFTNLRIWIQVFFFLHRNHIVEPWKIAVAIVNHCHSQIYLSMFHFRLFVIILVWRINLFHFQSAEPEHVIRGVCSALFNIVRYKTIISVFAA